MRCRSRLHDLNGGYPDSEPFVLNFTPVQTHHLLHITQIVPVHAARWWPTNTSGGELLSLDSLAAESWANVTNARGVAGTEFTMRVPAFELRQSFRLHQR